MTEPMTDGEAPADAGLPARFESLYGAQKLAKTKLPDIIIAVDKREHLSYNTLTLASRRAPLYASFIRHHCARQDGKPRPAGQPAYPAHENQ